MTSALAAEQFLLERPFGRAAEHILSGWWQAAEAFARTSPADWVGASCATEVSAAFRALGNLATQFDPHLSEGLRVTGKRPPTFSRPYLLLLQHFRHPLVFESITTLFGPNETDRRNRPKQYLFSPFYLLRQMLTSPEFPASEAYAHLVVRAEIFRASLLFAGKLKRSVKPNVFDAIRSYIEFGEIAKSLQKAESYRRNNDTFYANTPTDFIVGHLLASRGLAVLTFAPGQGSYKSARKNERSMVGRDTFLRGKSIVTSSGIYEFRIVGDLQRLPSPADLVNELDGIPLPLPGADIVFARGIRSTTERGVVGRISGPSGAGKTTVALAVAIAFAPMGISTYYLSCEEDFPDLRKRIFTLTPPFISRTTTFPRDVSEWFHAEHLDLPNAQDNQVEAFRFIDEMSSVFERSGVSPSVDVPPGLLPLLVVLDGVHELIQHNSTTGQAANDQAAKLRELVEQFRTLRSFVLILTKESDEPVLRDLDFIVDFVVELGHHSVDVAEPPRRRFVLRKTRLQYARPGSHVLHISKRDGVKIYAQLPAQLDVFSNFRWKSPDQNSWFDFLQTGFGGNTSTKPLVRIFERSQMLLTGQGSAGKAGFAMKLLMKPFIGRQDDIAPLELSSPVELAPLREHRRLLIVSFLYDPTYYEELVGRLKRNLAIDSSTKQPPPPVKIDVLSLYPGFLPAEVLLYKIIQRIDQAILEGNPFSCLIVDGLHNIFLQFTHLENAPTFWPILFEICRIVGLSTVTTHTHFEVKGLTSSQLRMDVDIAMHRVGPLLQAIVNSSDFYIDISPSSVPQGDRVLFFLDVITALGQTIGQTKLYWDRAHSTVTVGSPFKDRDR